QVAAAYTQSPQSDATLQTTLQSMLNKPTDRYLVHGGRLYACSVRPLYFGQEKDGILLGYVISGFAIDRDIVRQISQATAVDAAFISEDQVLASTLEPSVSQDLAAEVLPHARGAKTPVTVELKNERYLASIGNLSPSSTAPLQLVLLKSFAQAEQSIRQID